MLSFLPFAPVTAVIKLVNHPTFEDLHLPRSLLQPHRAVAAAFILKHVFRRNERIGGANIEPPMRQLRLAIALLQDAA